MGSLRAMGNLSAFRCCVGFCARCPGMHLTPELLRGNLAASDLEPRWHIDAHVLGWRLKPKFSLRLGDFA
jgi:hypothetical protein